MIKEILQGNNNSREEPLTKRSNILFEKNINKNRRMNSVLNNFTIFKKISLKKKSVPNQLEKNNSLKIILANKNSNRNMKKISQTKSNNSISSSQMTSYKNHSNSQSINNIFNSCSLKRKNEISKEISSRKSLNFEERINSYENSLNSASNIRKKYFRKNINLDDGMYEMGAEENESENGCNKNKKIYIKNLKYENKLFLNNLEQEFEIRCLKKKIKKLKNKNISLTQKLDNYIEKNYIIGNKILKEQNKRKNIICSLININNNILNKRKYGEESSYKNLLYILMNLKYNYENTLLKNDFLSNVDTLFSLANIFSENNKRNNIYNNIKKLIRLKQKYIDDMKDYNLSQIKNKKYYDYCINLCQNLNINNIHSLYEYIKLIKSDIDEELRNLIGMKNILFDENKKKRMNINSSLDILKNQKRIAINYNYFDLQKYFIESHKNKKNNTKNKRIRKENENNNFFDFFNENEKIGSKTIRNENRIFYRNNREKCKNYTSLIGNDIKSMTRFKTDLYNMNIDNEKGKEKGKSLYYSSKIKISDIPYISHLNNRIEIKNFNNDSNITLPNKSIKYNKFHTSNIINKFNNSTSINIENVKKILNRKITKNGDISHNENYTKRNKYIKDFYSNYNNIIRIKKKSLNLKIPSLKAMRNCRSIYE